MMAVFAFIDASVLQYRLYLYYGDRDQEAV